MTGSIGHGWGEPCVTKSANKSRLDARRRRGPDDPLGQRAQETPQCRAALLCNLRSILIFSVRKGALPTMSTNARYWTLHLLRVALWPPPVLTLFRAGRAALKVMRR